MNRLEMLRSEKEAVEERLSNMKDNYDNIQQVFMKEREQADDTTNDVVKHREQTKMVSVLVLIQFQNLVSLSGGSHGQLSHCNRFIISFVRPALWLQPYQVP